MAPLVFAGCGSAPSDSAGIPFSVVDLSMGETQMLRLRDGTEATVQLVAIDDEIDDLAGVVRSSTVTIEVNGERADLVSANYRLPAEIGGVQVDCPITHTYLRNSRSNPWALEKDARIRIWPRGSSWAPDQSFRYPIRQKWFASYTQMANEPVHVDGGEIPNAERIYYHSGLDFGGAEGLTEVVAAVDALVISAGDSVFVKDVPDAVNPRYDVIYLRDARGWYYRYSHLHSFSDGIAPGVRVSAGQTIGLLGKEGGSGGWSHLHFEIVGLQPSGEYGTVEGYAFIWEAYVRENQPDLLAVAKPHQAVWSGATVTLDGSRSWSASGSIETYEWQLSDGTRADGPRLDQAYPEPGVFAEILKITDAAGHEAYDVLSVQVMDKKHPDQLPPTIHPAYEPTTGISPGMPVVFKVRSFRTEAWGETWDFDDGSTPVTVRSDGNREQHAEDGYAVTEHRFEQPGTYTVSVEHTNQWDLTATGRLVVEVR